MKTQAKNPKVVPKYAEDGLPQVLHANELLHDKTINKAQYQELIGIKRSRQKWEAEHIPLFFMIGLSLSLLLVTIAFNWKSYDGMGLVDLGDVNRDFDEIMEVPLSEQAPPPPPEKALEVFEIKEVDDEQIIEDIDIELDIEMTEDQVVEDVVYDNLPVVEMEEEKVEEIFQVVENWPAPEGGIETFYGYVAENMIYPAMALRLNVSGVVFVRFVVEKDGSITDVKVVKGIGAACDEEAVRVVSGAPAWHPGKQRGRPVRVYMTVPIRFVLKQR